MSADQASPRTASDILAALSEEEREELARKQYVKVDRDLVWIELEGAVRREPISALYYIRTSRGVFRVSRLNEEVVEV